jgi:hypothetical protein
MAGGKGDGSALPANAVRLGYNGPNDRGLFVAHPADA